ncbi:MFS transporter [Lactobacillus sp. HT06-2]|uniref:MFS transporter n=1 Tax=Lactobacillus sp. HT06-2 TaxID=2080222 RepID=UPI000CD8EA73|nr:MFS transporter [Lactobacillus sp. HT06-2]
MTKEEREVVRQWNPRYKRNVYIYLCIYGILGAVTGITNDAALSYYKIVAPHLISGLNIFNAATAILMSLMITTVHKWGYRKILLVLPPMTAIFMALTCVTTNQAVIMIAYTISWTAIGVYDLMYPLMWTSYVPGKIRTKMFSVVMIVNLITQTICTFLGGKAIVLFFSMIRKISYGEASTLSARPETMVGQTLVDYTNSYRILLLITAAVTMLAFILALFIKDIPSDYRSEGTASNTKTDKKAMYKKLLNKKAVMWIAYIAGVQLGARLIAVYVPIYLNNYLHIPRDVTSPINTFVQAAMLIGYFFAPFLEKKLGAIVSVAAGTLTCVPVMLLLANGRHLGSGMVLFVIVGILLFLRTGLANATMPIQQEVQMVIVDKDLRPAFTAVVQIAYAVVGVIDGLFTEFYLFNTQDGYANAYYIAAVIYVIASVVLLVFFAKKYNRILETSHQQEE